MSSWFKITRILPFSQACWIIKQCSENSNNQTSNSPTIATTILSKAKPWNNVWFCLYVFFFVNPVFRVLVSIQRSWSIIISFVHESFYAVVWIPFLFPICWPNNMLKLPTLAFSGLLWSLLRYNTNKVKILVSPSTLKLVFFCYKSNHRTFLCSRSFYQL